jgi:hypothetical protein
MGLYLRVAALIRQISTVDEHVTLWNLDGAIVRIRNADESCLACSLRRAYGCWLQFHLCGDAGLSSSQ